MEEILSIVINGCKLARELESNIQPLSGQPNVLFNSCYEIVRVFEGAINGLSSLMIINSSSSYPPPPPPPQQHHWAASDHHHLDPGVQDWLKSSYLQAIQLLSDPTHHHHQHHHNNPFTTTTTTTTTTTSTSSMTTQHVPEELGLMEIPPVTTGGLKIHELSVDEIHGGEQEGSDSGKSPMAVVQRSRKRKEGVVKRMMRVAAAGGSRQGLIGGSMEIPPDDGFTWRKYGQKEILGSTFPRGYYRCTHKSFYGCEAKKQVQRLDHDPNMFEVTYYGHHTCHISSSSSAFLGFGGSSSSSAGAGAAAAAGGGLLSSVQQQQQQQVRDIIGREIEGSSPVVDLVDAIFNSGSSGNSMDSIFPSFQPDN